MLLHVGVNITARKSPTTVTHLVQVAGYVVVGLALVIGVFARFKGNGLWSVMLRDLAHGKMVLFIVVKLALVSLGSLFLWRNRNHPFAVVAIFLAFFVP